MFTFEKLEVWQKAIAFADQVYTSTRDFPSDERFGLTNQMRRAAVSVSSNIAEGTSRSSKVDFARFVEIATGSLFEVVSQAFIAKNQGFLTTEQFDQIYITAQEQGRMLSGPPTVASPQRLMLAEQRLSTINSPLSTLPNGLHRPVF
jgi:four helix bundle protein